MEARLFIDGDWRTGAKVADVLDKYSGQPFATAHLPSDDQIEQALSAVVRAAAGGPVPAYDRYEALVKASRLLDARRQDFISLMATEAGFPRRDADGEISRAVQTLALSGEEAKRLEGEIVPIDGAPGGQGRFAFTLRVPVGVVCAVTPFNAPLNTVAHKIAPALAAGNAVILKPSGLTPLTACRLVDLLIEAGIPPQFLSVLHGEGERVAGRVIADPRVRFITFTGSTDVGRTIQTQAGLRRTQLELGSIAATIVCADADVGPALPKVVGSSFRKAGQVCTSIQLLYVHRSRMAEVRDGLLTAARSLTVGDPAGSDDPDVGPLISRRAAERVEGWIGEAVGQGADLLCGGIREGNCIIPAVLADTVPDMRVRREEIFGPVINLIAFDDIEDPIAAINALPFGLATGVFTRDLQTAFSLVRRLDVGGVHINETCSSRVDLMPYGGVKDSGFGREGPRYAAREMTEERTITITA